MGADRIGIDRAPRGQQAEPDTISPIQHPALAGIFALTEEITIMATIAKAFLPLLIRSGGAIVNNLSVNALAPLPLIPAYSISKAAAFNSTQSLRALLTERGVRVHAVLTGPFDTDMTCGLDIPKASPSSIASGVFDGVESEQEDIFPDPMSQS
jgi:NAD(P)-dependent dehydrogenase (short-subunit alcohol dehydrogenase family)